MNFKNPEVKRIIGECIRRYESVVRGAENAAAEQSGRTYGGVVRAAKGTLVEDMAKNLLLAAWIGRGKDAGRLEFNLHKKYDIPIKREYVENIPDAEIRNEILPRIEEYKIKHGTDIHAYADGEFFLSVECKAYAENAMLKRILFDGYLLKTRFPNLRFALVQLESMLGGDYAALPKKPRGGKSSHTLMSYMDGGDLRIITLLEEERKVDRPIHKKKFYKKLSVSSLENAVSTLAELLPE